MTPPIQRIITEGEIMARQTPLGGWKKIDLAEWGVPWPPPTGWKEALITHGLPYQGEDPGNPLEPTRALDIRDGKIHYQMFGQDDVLMPAVCKDTAFNRKFVVWVRRFDRALWSKVEA